MESAQRTTGKNKFFHSIGFRLSASIGAVVATFSAALIIAAYLVFNNYTVSSARRQYQETANTVSANYDNYFSSVISVSNCIASLTYNLSDLTASKDSLVNEFDSIMSVSQRQMVEIAKAVSYDAKVIVLDEPTSSLSEREVKKLFGIISTLRSKGVSFVFISHKMDEIFQICDDVAVLRDGHMMRMIEAKIKVMALAIATGKSVR